MTTPTHKTIRLAVALATAVAAFALAAPLAQAAPTAPQSCMQTSAYPGWVTVFDEQGVPTLYPIKYAPFSAQSCLQAQAQSGASGGQTSDGSVTNTGMKSPYPGWVVVIDEQGVPTLYPTGSLSR
jgi:hypothetical protein